MSEDLVITPNNPFLAESWSDNAPVIVEKTAEETATPTTENKTDEPIVEKKTETDPKPTEVNTTTTTSSDEEIIEPSDYLKKKWGWENEETADKEIKELRELKNKKQDDPNFADEQSKHIYELLKGGKKKEVKQFLETQEKLETLVSTEVNEDTAAEIIKMGMKLKYKDLSDSQIEHKFNKQFAIPKEPVESTNETQEEFEERHKEWEQQVKDTKMDRIIEAQLAKPELEKIKSELVLPDIQREAKHETVVQSQEELDRIDGIRNSFLKKLESDYRNFNGYEIKYKDEEVEIPVSFAITDEEKVALKGELENFDVDGFIGTRWFNEDGSPNVTQMMDDVTLLRNKEKVLQKVANEVGAQMRLHYMGKKANVNVTNQKEVFQPNGEQSDLDKQVEFLWQQK